MKSKTENIVEYYYEKLGEATNVGSFLADFYCSMNNLPKTKDKVIMCNKLNKKFGRYILFFSIVDISKMEIQREPYALLYTICKNRFEEQHNGVTAASMVDMSREINKLKAEIEKSSKIVLKPKDSSKL